MINTEFVSIFKEFSPNIQFSESKWYNGRSYLPLYQTTITFDYLDWNIVVLYEYRESFFSSKGNDYSSAYVNRHLFSLHCSTEDLSLSRFQIYFTDGFLLFGKGKLKIKCNERNLKTNLLKSTNLLDIASLVKNSSEFSPVISGKKKSQHYDISINFLSNATPIIETSKLLLFLTEFIEFSKS